MLRRNSFVFLIPTNILKLLAKAIVITSFRITRSSMWNAWNGIKGVLELINGAMNMMGIDVRL
jgi:hypothetical protein